MVVPRWLEVQLRAGLNQSQDALAAGPEHYLQMGVPTS
jgi:hypothetical protein